jgi:branched-chain amino acid transport system ATP-binding protein
MTLLAVRSLSKSFGGVAAARDASFTLERGEMLAIIGPNGAGKSTVLHSLFGFARVFGGAITIGGRDITHLGPERKLAEARIAYVLQDKSVFPDMTVEENLVMGGYLLRSPSKARAAAERVFAKYDRLAARRAHKARVLSGGERRLLEISRALVMEPEVLLVDEPSIGLEPRFIDMVFDILGDLQHNEGKTVIIVEQNAKKGLEFSDIGYVLLSGRLALAGKADDLLRNPDVGRLFLGG